MSKPFLQVVSDLHLEFHKGPVIMTNFLKPVASNLAICGDLGYPYMTHYKHFLSQCSKAFDNTFFIAGNHEYYQGQRSNLMTMGWTFDQTNKELKSIAKSFPNVHFLHNSHFELFVDDKEQNKQNEQNEQSAPSNQEKEKEMKKTKKKVILIGSTLWSHIPADKKQHVAEKMNDYRQIFTTDEDLITVDEINIIHQDNVKYLARIVDEFKNDNLIIVTHHLPSEKLITPAYANSSLNCAFFTNLEHLMKPNVKYWLAGHTHAPIKTSVNECALITNPLGYPGENTDKNLACTIDL